MNGAHDETPGLAAMRAIRDGRAPPPPMAALVAFDMSRAEPGEVEMTLQPRGELLNALGLLHGGTAATMLDTAMGAAVQTLLPAGKTAVTQDLKLSYLRPLPMDSGPVKALGRVMNLGRQTAYVEGFVHGANGKLAVHAVATFSVIGA